jgi:UDP-N-acetylmuramate dehydrogenase
VGAGIYGNAGAYGRSISDSLSRVRYLQGDTITEIGNHGCRFTYRESVFKSHKDWIILSAEFTLREGDPALLLRTAADILTVRNRKYPPEMRCAGSIFKNLMLAELPEEAARTVPEALVREGKVPSAFFLEQVGAKGMRRGGIRVADYHANLIYNEGGGAASDLRGLIRELKTRVRDKFGLELEEEVQYVGFCDGA